MKLNKNEKSFFNREFKKNLILNEDFNLRKADDIENGRNVTVLFRHSSPQNFYFELAAIKNNEESVAYIQCGEEKGVPFFHIMYLMCKDLLKLMQFKELYTRERKEA